MPNRFILFGILMVTGAFAKTITVPVIRTPVVDGNVSRSEWSGASVDSGFVQIEPEKGAPTTEKTRIRIGMDRDRLYVAFQCFTGNANTITDGNPQRDQFLSGKSGSNVAGTSSDDGAMVLIDSFHDRRSAYLFRVSVRNTQTDIRIENNGGSQDKNWDTEWKSATARDSSGWSAEFAIPFKSIKFASGKTWGINFGRTIARNQETAWWSGILDDHFRISQAGELSFFEPPRQKKPMMWIPYANGYRESANGDWHREAGIDVEIPITSDVSANVTVNPDFASVEGDQEVINLDPWEISFPEKRPFFRDVNALFDVRYQPFYSRRIGDIRHGEKFSGKIGSVQMAGVFARTYAAEADPVKRILYKAPANFSIFRIQKSILSASTMGITITEKRQAAQSTRRVFSLDTQMRLPYHIYTTGQLFITSPTLSGNHWTDGSGGFLRIASETNIYHVHTRLSLLGRQLMENMNATGYLQFDNAAEFDSELWYRHWLKSSSTVKFIHYRSNYKWNWSIRDGMLRRYEFLQEGTVYFTNRLSLETHGRYEYRDATWRKNGQSRPYKKTVEFDAGYNTLEYNYAKAGMVIGQNFDGPSREVRVSARFRILQKLGLNYEMDVLRYDKAKADPVARNVDLHVVGADIRFQRDLFVRIFTQHRSDTDRFYFYGQFGYQYVPPNSAVYLTYSYDDQEGRTEPYRVVFLKLSHQFSIPMF